MAKHKKKGRKNNDEEENGKGSGFGLGISQETSNSIAGIFCFLIVVVSILAFVGKAGSAGIYFNLTARSLFGWGFFIVPVAFDMLGVAFIKSIHRKVAVSALLGTLLFVLSVLGVFYSLGEGDTSARIAGILGDGLRWPLLSFLGFYTGYSRRLGYRFDTIDARCSHLSAVHAFQSGRRRGARSGDEGKRYRETRREERRENAGRKSDSRIGRSCI
jgi:hypothetical protein